MMVDEMTDFFYQTLMTMADTYNRATQHEELVEEMKKFAHEFYHKSREKQLKKIKPDGSGFEADVKVKTIRLRF
jgi:uncharacterized protein YktA (UPF0223 family)